MNAPKIIRDVTRAGGQLQADRGDLVITAPAPLPQSLIEAIKQHKAELLDAITADRAVEARRQRVLAMLAERPEARYALLTDTTADPEAVIVALAIRGRATCELRIPREKYDPFLLLHLIERHGATVH